MRMHEAPGSEQPAAITAAEQPTNVESHETVERDDRVEDLAILLMRQHLTGEKSLTSETTSPDEDMAEMMARIAREKAREILDASENATREKKSVMRPLMGRLQKYALVAGVGTSLGASLGINYVFDERAEQRRETEAAQARANHEAAFNLTGLDREATTERLDRLLETYPKGWTRDLAKLTYLPIVEKSNPAYGLDSLAAARTVANKDQTFSITYFRSSRGSAAESLNATLSHELAHVNDWRNPHLASAEEIARMEALIVSRLASPSRFKSSYVEEINNVDKAVEKERKIGELWAETHEAYLDARDPAEVLSATDLAMVEDSIKRADPDFDQQASLENRRRILDDMAAAQFGERLEVFMAHLPIDNGKMAAEVPADLKERLQKQWWNYRFPDSPERQVEGRKALLDFVNRWKENKGSHYRSLLLIASLGNLDQIARHLADGYFADDREFSVRELGIFTMQNRESVSREANEKIDGEFRELTERFAFTSEARLTDGEYIKLMTNPDLVTLMSYEPSKEDRPLKRFINAACYTDFAAARREAELLPL